MVRHAPIHRRSGHSDIAICCGRNVRGSSPSTSVVPLSNQVTTLNHKRFKGFKMFSDGHLGLTTAAATLATPAHAYYLRDCLRGAPCPGFYAPSPRYYVPPPRYYGPSPYYAPPPRYYVPPRRYYGPPPAYYDYR